VQVLIRLDKVALSKITIKCGLKSVEIGLR